MNAEEKSKDTDIEQDKKETKEPQAKPEPAPAEAEKQPKQQQQQQPRQEAQRQQTQAEKQEAVAKAKKKINRLSLKEIEKKIRDIQEKMGGLNSSYARQLLKRKEQLLPKPEVDRPQEEDAISRPIQ